MRVWRSDGSGAACLTDALCINKDIIKKRSKMDCCIISVIGGGGKTSLLYLMSRELAADGFRVALTTTTHMIIPKTFPWTESVDEAARMLSREPVLVAHKVSSDASGTASSSSNRYDFSSMDNGSEDAVHIKDGAAHKYPLIKGKCTALTAEEFAVLRREADIILVEADGARQLPIKAAAAHEPVIMPDSDYVIAVAGIDAIGQPLQKVCHRPWLAAGRFGVPLDMAVTEKMLADLLTDPVIGQMKGIAGRGKSQSARQFRVLVNKADDEGRRKSAFEICRMLSSRGLISAVSALRDRVALIVLAAGQGKRFTHNKNDSDGTAVVRVGDQRYIDETGTEHLRRSDKNTISKSESGYIGYPDKEAVNKLEYCVRGEPIYAGLLRAVRELISGYGDEIIHEKILVTQEARHELRRAAEADGFKIVINQQPWKGISSSIKLGINAAEASEAYLFTVCDQPKLTSRTFYRLIEAYQYGSGSIAAVRSMEAFVNAQAAAGGNPNIFSVRYRSDLLALEGDMGGKNIIRKHETETSYVDVPSEELFDIDTKGDLWRFI